MQVTSTDTFESFPNTQLSELATIFAAGILRLRARPGLASELSPKLSESGGQCLEFQATNRLSVHSG